MLLVVFLATVACHGGGRTPPLGSRAVPLPGFEQLSPRTTRADIAVHNLESEIHPLENLEAQGKLGLDQARTLGALWMVRAQYLGQLGDYVRALRLAEEQLAAHPAAGRAWAFRAQVRGRVHLFDGALADLKEARARGEPASPSTEAGLRWAKGHPGALEVFERSAAQRRSFETLTALAGALAEKGDLPRALEAYGQAGAEYRDVSPFALAWLDFQVGLVLERMGDLDGAGRAWARAHVRLPQFSAAAGHLAEIEAARGFHSAAIALLEPAVARGGDPEHAAQLAASYSAVGAIGPAAMALEEARRGYEQLLRDLPLAYADHAARFFLGPGHDASRALGLAQANLTNRSTREACELYEQALRTLGACSDACP